MNMYLYHGMSVCFGESLEKVGVNLREVPSTVFVGVPRIYEKILAKVQDRAAAKSKLNGAVFSWAVEIGKQCAQLASDRRPVPLLLSLKRKVADVLAFARWRQAMGGRIRIFVSGGAPLSDDVPLAFAGAGMPIVHGYGLTATSPVITAGPPYDNGIAPPCQPPSPPGSPPL